MQAPGLFVAAPLEGEKERKYMRKLAVFGALVALAIMPAFAQAAPSTAVVNTVFKRGVNAPLWKPAPTEGAATLQRVHWYYDYNGVAWSNICQTPDFWVSFGSRYYVVGSRCVATYAGMTAYGVMVAR
jgi:hypothetical protein